MQSCVARKKEYGTAINNGKDEGRITTQLVATGTTGSAGSAGTATENQATGILNLKKNNFYNHQENNWINCQYLPYLVLFNNNNDDKHNTLVERHQRTKD